MGNVDLFHSRRTNYHKCTYWVRDERNASGSPREWVMYKQPSGKFYAKIVSVKSNQMNVINGVWALDKDYISLQSDDEIHDICRGCLVDFNEELWLVESVQRDAHHKESEFARKIDYLTTLTLTKV